MSIQATGGRANSKKSRDKEPISARQSGGGWSQHNREQTRKTNSSESLRDASYSPPSTRLSQQPVHPSVEVERAVFQHRLENSSSVQ